MRARVLTVEDDDRIRAGIRMALEAKGCTVAEAATGEDALEAIPREQPELILVDLMLPGMSGLDVVRSVRVVSDVPIVIVTARSDSHDVVAGLEAGADDYVRKPFALHELLARIRALLRRSESSAGPRDAARVLELDGLELHQDSGRVRRDGVEIALTRTEFQLLFELAQHAGVVLTREHLLERVWGYGYFGDTRLVDAHIHRLRVKVEADPADPQLIVTVRGFGYTLQR